MILQKSFYYVILVLILVLYENSSFCILWWIDSLKEHNLFKIFYCNIINYFYVTFDQFDAFLLNKSINFLQKIILTPDFEQ